ncbi:MAG: OAM dimerization domain-containing protein [Bacilli bacterium]
MSGYSMDEKSFDTTLDLKKLKPYGDTMNDGKVQMSFTLPVPNDERAEEAAVLLMTKAGFSDINVCYAEALDENFTHIICYGSLIHSVDYDSIVVSVVEGESMDMYQINDYIDQNIGREVKIIGASTGTDAHTVGIDAIMNMKGFAGHYGLERYKNIEAFNMGSQVENIELIKKAVEMEADAILVSQTVTQKDVHLQNLTEFIELLEAQNLRDKFIVICGGPRLSHEIAQELGFDAGFGKKKFADDVASYIVQEMVRKEVR